MRRIQVIGNLTANAEVREVSNKKAINFSLATNEKYKDSNGLLVEKDIAGYEKELKKASSRNFNETAIRAFSDFLRKL